MQITDYINWKEIYRKVRKNHLKEYPTAKHYTEYLISFEEPHHYVKDLYEALNQDFSDFDTPSSDNYDDSILIKYLSEKQLYLELSVGGNNATENGDDYWGYGYGFTIDLDTELFVGYDFENYS